MPNLESRFQLPAGLWVILEHKAGRLIPANVEQLAACMSAGETEFEEPEPAVIGVLLGDGWTDVADERLAWCR